MKKLLGNGLYYTPVFRIIYYNIYYNILFYINNKDKWTEINMKERGY